MDWIKAFIWTMVIAGACALFTYAATAEPIAEPTSVSFEVYKVGSFRDADFADSETKNQKGIAFLIDLSVFKYFTWHNRIWSHGNDAKLYTVGWEYDLSASLHKNVEVFHYHHSQHAMDEPTAAWRYPLRNYYGVRFNFMGETQ